MELDCDLLEALWERAWNPRRMVDLGPGLSPPVTRAQVQASEQRLGFSLPSTLIAAFRLVGNGGFGPGYGLLGLEGGAPVQTRLEENERPLTTTRTSAVLGMKDGGGLRGCCLSATGAA